MMRVVRAADFYSDTPPARIGGAECEYDLQLAGQIGLDGETSTESFLANRVQAFLRNHVLRAAGYQALTLNDDGIAPDSYLSNGARAYRDLGFFEYCTPEVLGPANMAAADAAGILALERIVAAADRPHKGVYRRTGSAFNAERTAGYHQNFLMPSSLRDRSQLLAMPLLASNLATRAWSWSGTVGKAGYEWSQKHRGIGLSVSSNKNDRVGQGRKPMILVRGVFNEDHDVNPMPEWSRAEVRCADAPVSRTALYLGFAATSLVLRLGEHLPAVRGLLDDGLLQEPVTAMQQLAVHPTLEANLRLRDGRLVAADNVQESQLIAVRRLAEEVELPADELAAIPLLEQANSAQRLVRTEGDIGPLAVYCEAARKLRYLRRRFGSQPLAMSHPDHREAVATDLLYDRVDRFKDGQRTGYGRQLAEAVPEWAASDERCVPQSLVDHFVKHPDAAARSAVRSDYVRGEPDTPDHIDWSGFGANRYAYDMRWRDPYGTV